MRRGGWLEMVVVEKKEGDDVNWFGVKLGLEKSSTNGTNGSNASGVGKYLNLKRPLETATVRQEDVMDDEGKKKRKIGFGNFDNW